MPASHAFLKPSVVEGKKYEEKFYAIGRTSRMTATRPQIDQFDQMTGH